MHRSTPKSSKAEPRLKVERSAPLRCARCGRPLEPASARTVEGYGPVGSDCYAKVAAYPRYVQQFVPELAHGPAEFEMVETTDGGYTYSEEARELVIRAQTAHLQVSREFVPGEPPRLRLELRPHFLPRLNLALQNYGYQAWAEEQKRADMERREAAEWGKEGVQ